MKKNDHFIIKIILIIYALILFAFSISIPVFDTRISEEGKFSLYFLQDASFAWVSGIFVYFFGQIFLDFMKKKPFSSLQDNDENK